MASPHSPSQWSVGATSVSLLGELVVTRDNAFDVAEAVNTQAAAIFADPAGWSKVRVGGGGTIEAKPVSGAFAATGIVLTRGSKEVQVPADDLFGFLISPKGYQLIDPMSEPEEFAKYLERFEGWRPHVRGAKLEMANAFVPMWKKLQKKQEFIILNSHDPTTRVFTSTSMLHHSRPGGSKYQSEMAVNGPETVRVLNTFAVQCHPVGTERCRVDVLQWADMSTGDPARENRNMENWWGPWWERLAKAEARGSAKL